MTATEKKARQLLMDWRNKQGHDRCWYYPEIFRSLCDLFEVPTCPDPGLPPRDEFREGCCRYEDEQYGPLPSSLLIRAEVRHASHFLRNNALWGKSVVALYLDGATEAFTTHEFECKLAEFGTPNANGDVFLGQQAEEVQKEQKLEREQFLLV